MPFLLLSLSLPLLPSLSDRFRYELLFHWNREGGWWVDIMKSLRVVLRANKIARNPGHAGEINISQGTVPLRGGGDVMRRSSLRPVRGKLSRPKYRAFSCPSSLRRGREDFFHESTRDERSFEVCIDRICRSMLLILGLIKI